MLYQYNVDTNWVIMIENLLLQFWRRMSKIQCMEGISVLWQDVMKHVIISRIPQVEKMYSV